MDYLIQNAAAVMQLCFGFGFLILVIFTVRALIILTRLLEKMDRLTDLFIEYVQKPLQMFHQIYKTVSQVLSFFRAE